MRPSAIFIAATYTGGCCGLFRVCPEDRSQRAAGSAIVRTSLAAGACKTPSNWARTTGSGGSSDSDFDLSSTQHLPGHEPALDLDEFHAFGRI